MEEHYLPHRIDVRIKLGQKWYLTVYYVVHSEFVVFVPFFFSPMY